MILLSTLLVMPLVGMAEPVGEEIKPSIEYAKSWDAAVEEARLLNLPIVVHSHGFY